MQGKMAVEKLQEQMKAAKESSAAMEKMKKQREKETAIVKVHHLAERLVLSITSCR
eukprot:COSAG06_NODE_27700_length_588_cov_0.719836_2_plen_56_part_00